MTSSDKILILDFGSQTTQLIARRIREAHVYSEIYPCHAPLEVVRAFEPKGIILSGGPASVYDPDAPLCAEGILGLGVPILGICYGMQWLTHTRGGRVGKARKREYGRAELVIDEAAPFFRGIGKRKPQGRVTQVWMSHGDRIERPPKGWLSLAHTANAPTAAMSDATGRLFGVQFHPEVVHTPQGTAMLRNFAYRICGCRPTWTMQAFAQRAVEQIREAVGKEKVICALSGGVDSSVVAALAHRAVGKQLTCIFVDNGLLRKGEARSVVETFRKQFRMNLRVVDAADRFLTKLRGVADPERKRRIIGREFIRLFEEESDRVGRERFLAQGTLYPDVIESISFRGPSVTIKTHHNVGGIPTRMRFKLIEPLRELFKDEVRELGREMRLPEEILWRQPFPGPGLAIRILGSVTRERLEILREADAIVMEEIKGAGLYRKLWQSFAVLLPVRTVGVMGDVRTYENVIAIRAVTSQDAMTADWATLPHDLLGQLANRIINEVRGVNRVVYDISSKPPSTIEWE